MSKPMTTMTDEEVALQVQKGDTESFGVLVERYEAKLSRYGKKFLSNGQDIEDLVQDIFMKAYTNIKSFNPQMRFSPWIYRIAHNEYVNALKKISHRNLLVFDFDTFFPHPVAPETADQEAQAREVKEMIDSSLSGLDAKYREPIILHYLEEMNYQEISEILHIPVSTVGVRLNRARTMLKNIYDRR